MPTLQEAMMAVVLPAFKTVVEFLAQHPEANQAIGEAADVTSWGL